MLRAKLGFAKYNEEVNKVAKIRCQLQWIEPFVWMLGQLRWTIPQNPAMTNVDKRASSFSWLELACLTAVLTGNAVGPHNASFLQLIAVVKQLWVMLHGFFEMSNDDGERLPLKQSFKLSDVAGAAIACGMPSSQGLNRRCILEDLPGISISVATLIKYASAMPDRLRTSVPGYRWWKSKWQASGMLETHTQLRRLHYTEAIEPNQMQIDHLRWRPRRVQRKAPLQGPCVFGCTTSTNTIASARTRQRWYRVPAQSPWPGIPPGEVLCMKCYSWGISGPRARARKLAQPYQSDVVRIKIGSQYVIKDLANRTELNGRTVTALMLPDDLDRVMVKCGDQYLRLLQRHLAVPVQVQLANVARVDALGCIRVMQA